MTTISNLGMESSRTLNNLVLGQVSWYELNSKHPKYNRTILYQSRS